MTQPGPGPWACIVAKGHAEPTALFTAAVDKFLLETEQDSEDLPIGDRFCREALRASFFSWSNKPNPRIELGADLFVQSEIERLLSGDNCPQLLKAIEISGERDGSGGRRRSPRDMMGR